MLWKCCTQYASKFGKLSSGHRIGKAVFIPIPRKRNTKKCSNYHTVALVLHVSEVMLKILQARPQQYVNREFPDVQVGFRKGRGTRDQIANICWVIKKKQESSRKTSTSASLTTLNPLTVCITTNCGKFLKRWEYQTPLPASWETCMQVKKQKLEFDKEQQTGSKLGTEYIKAVYYHPVYLTHMQSTSYEMPGCLKHKLESRLLGEISITSDMQMTPSFGRKQRGTE